MKALALAVWLSAAAAAAQEPGSGELGPVDLNSASIQQLETLPGIGPKRAEAIVELRKHRPYTRITQLLEVRGIGKKTLERLKARVKADAPEPHEPHPGVPAPVPAAPPLVR